MTTFIKPLLKRIKLLPRDKEKYIEYDLWHCPRCKYMEFRKHWNIVGRCHCFNLLLVSLGRYDLLHSNPDLCHSFNLGKFKAKKKTVKKESKRVKSTTKIRKVLSR